MTAGFNSTVSFTFCITSVYPVRIMSTLPTVSSLGILQLHTGTRCTQELPRCVNMPTGKLIPSWTSELRSVRTVQEEEEVFGDKTYTFWSSALYGGRQYLGYVFQLFRTILIPTHQGTLMRTYKKNEYEIYCQNKFGHPIIEFFRAIANKL